MHNSSFSFATLQKVSKEEHLWSLWKWIMHWFCERAERIKTLNNNMLTFSALIPLTGQFLFFPLSSSSLLHHRPLRRLWRWKHFDTLKLENVHPLSTLLVTFHGKLNTSVRMKRRIHVSVDVHLNLHLNSPLHLKFTFARNFFRRRDFLSALATWQLTRVSVVVVTPLPSSTI